MLFSKSLLAVLVSVATLSAAAPAPGPSFIDTVKDKFSDAKSAVPADDVARLAERNPIGNASCVNSMMNCNSSEIPQLQGENCECVPISQEGDPDIESESRGFPGEDAPIPASAEQPPTGH